MCQFGDSSEILEELEVEQENAIVGYRGWYIKNSFTNKEKLLHSLNVDFDWPFTITEGNPLRDNSEGIYAYNNYNCYNNYNNNYYNYYCYNNYNNYNNCYNNYYIVGKCLLFGKIFKYREGYRSSKAIVTELVMIDNLNWLGSKIENEQKFIKHFYSVINEVANNYKAKVIPYSESEK